MTGDRCKFLPGTYRRVLIGPHSLTVFLSSDIPHFGIWLSFNSYTASIFNHDLFDCFKQFGCTAIGGFFHPRRFPDRPE